MFDPIETARLKEALDAYDQAYFATLPSAEELSRITFPEAFERKMQRLLRQADRVYYPLINTLAKRVACAVIALLMAMSITTLSVDAFREPFFQFIVNVYEHYAQLFFPTEETAATFTPIIPDYIPEGFELVSHTENNTRSFSVYRNSAGKEFAIEQIADNGKSISHIDAESAQFKKITLSETVEAVFTEKEDYCNLIFKHQDIVDIFGQISQEEAKLIAKSIIS